MKGIMDMRNLMADEIEIAFDLRFVPQIRDTGRKIHTIRRDEENRLMPGVKIVLSCGGSHLVFDEKVITAVQHIIIHIHILQYVKYLQVFVDGRKLEYREIVELAKNDGFDDVNDFISFFGLGRYEGKLIHWTNKRY